MNAIMDYDRCPECNGTGKVRIVHDADRFRMPHAVGNPNSPTIRKDQDFKTCQTCGGSGTLEIKH
jgi:uncharacterized protein with PIN domain